MNRIGFVAATFGTGFLAIIGAGFSLWLMAGSFSP